MPLGTFICPNDGTLSERFSAENLKLKKRGLTKCNGQKQNKLCILRSLEERNESKLTLQENLIPRFFNLDIKLLGILGNFIAYEQSRFLVLDPCGFMALEPPKVLEIFF